MKLVCALHKKKQCTTSSGLVRDSAPAWPQCGGETGRWTDSPPTTCWCHSHDGNKTTVHLSKPHLFLLPLMYFTPACGSRRSSGDEHMGRNTLPAMSSALPSPRINTGKESQPQSQRVRLSSSLPLFKPFCQSVIACWCFQVTM